MHKDTDRRVREVAETVLTSKQYTEAGKPSAPQQIKNETKAFRKFETEPAKVVFSADLKLNLGNYESAGVMVSVSLPCYLEEVDETFERAKQWVEERLQSEVEEIRSNKPSIF